VSLAKGQFGVLVGYEAGDVIRTPLEDIAGRTKPIGIELIELARVLAK
jgi:hypothetical protein